jgi:hypothetical protein
MVSVKYMFIVLAADDDGKNISTPYSAILVFKVSCKFSVATCTYVYALMIHWLIWRGLGEGGTFALYSLLAKYSNIVRRDPNTAGTVKMKRHLTNELKPMNKGVRSFIENSMAARIALKIFGVLGVSMVMASLLEPNSDQY